MLVKSWIFWLGFYVLVALFPSNSLLQIFLLIIFFILTTFELNQRSQYLQGHYLLQEVFRTVLRAFLVVSLVIVGLDDKLSFLTLRNLKRVSFLLLGIFFFTIILELLSGTLKLVIASAKIAKELSDKADTPKKPDLANFDPTERNRVALELGIDLAKAQGKKIFILS